MQVAGSFNDWIPESLTENSSGEWTGAFSLAPGDYLYKYIVEGEWVVDPTREVIIDDAGIENNRIVVEDRVTKCIREVSKSSNSFTNNTTQICSNYSLFNPPWKSQQCPFIGILSRFLQETSCNQIAKYFLTADKDNAGKKYKIQHSVAALDYLTDYEGLRSSDFKFYASTSYHTIWDEPNYLCMTLCNEIRYHWPTCLIETDVAAG